MLVLSEDNLFITLLIQLMKDDLDPPVIWSELYRFTSELRVEMFQISITSNTGFVRRSYLSPLQ